MRVRSTSLSTRVLSVVLALVMVIGMVPMSVFAAPATDDSTTAINISKVKDYAQMLLNENYAKDKGDEPTWDTEGNKGDTWRYYNGLMVDALLMLGVNSDNDVTKGNGNALEYAAAFYDYNVTSSGLIKRYNSTDISKQELDSIQPARALFDLLGTTVDQDKYETVLHNMYTELMSFPKYGSQGGNFRHKDSWGDWEIGLDGLYMAQPFLMEYANAIDGKLLSNSKSVTTSTIYGEVYTRMHWVANNMALTDASGNKLLNHGYDKDGDNNVSDKIPGNGVVWTRAVGWYLAALVDVIEMMPAGDNKTALIADLKTLLDGMLAYQDKDSGLWYNVVYATDGSEVLIGDKVNSNNRLETSGTALMAYALLKAYNNNWVTDASYKNAGLAAFNGIVNGKMTGSAGSYKVSDIYRSAGVADFSDMAGEYCNSNLYKDDEAKGVGPLIMAAAEASEAIGEVEAFEIGVASAPSNLTVYVGDTTIDTSKVNVTMVGNQGTVKTVGLGELKYELSDTSTVGTATVTVYNGSRAIAYFASRSVDSAIDTFTVKVVARAGEGTTENTYTFSAPDDVSEGSDGSAVTEGTVYNGYFTVVGDVKRDVSSSVIKRVELAQDVGGALQFTVAEGSTATVTVSFSSNGDSNTSEAGIVDANGNVVPEDTGKTNVKGTSAVEFKYTNLPAGTYRICSPTSSSSNNRIVRLYSVTVVESGSSGGSPGGSGSGGSSGGSSGDVSVPSVDADTVYTRLTALTNKFTYVVLGRNSSQRTATHGTDPGVQEAAWTSVEGGWKYGAAAHIWVIEKIDNSSNYYIYYMDGATKYYLNGNGSNNLVCSTTADTQWAITFNGEQADIRVASGSHGNADNRIYLNIDGSNGPKFESSAQSLNLYAPVNTGHTHSYTASVTTQPGCETTGVRTYTCSCGDSYTEAIAALGHSYTSQEFYPNCTTDGYILYTCGTCGNTYTEAGMASQGHNYVDGVCSYCGAADPNYNPGGSDTPATDKFVIPTAMVNGKQYLLNNSENAARAAYWDGNSWETGSVTVTNSDDIYTVTPSTGYTLLTWESKDGSATQGYFSFMDNGSKVYISGVDAVTSSKSSAAVFTVDLTNKTVKLGDRYIKIESSGGLKLYDSAQNSMRLFTPTTSSGGGETPTPPPSTGSTYIHIFETNQKESDFYEIVGDNLSTSKGSATVNGTTYDTCLKMNGNANISFDAATAGTFTMVFNTGSAGKTINVNDTVYTIPANGVLEVNVPAGNNVITRNEGESFLFYMAFTEKSGAVSYSLSDLVFNPSSIKAGESTAVTTTVTASDGSSHTYTLQWKVNSTVMGDTGLSTGFTAMDAGEYTVTATLTHVDGEPLANPIVKTGTINVSDATVTSGTLNNASVTVTQGTNINLSALSATLTYSNGNTSNVNLSQSGFTFKVNGSNINITDVDATVGTQKVEVFYNGVSVGELTVTVNKQVEVTDTVIYELDTDGIDDGAEYIVVDYYNSKPYALGHNSGATTEKAYSVTIEGNKVIIDESNVATALWKFEKVDSDTYYVSNGGYYLKQGSTSVFNNSKTTVDITVHDLATGQYRIDLNSGSNIQDLTVSNGDWTRGGSSDTLPVYLYKKVEAQNAATLTLNSVPMLYIGGTPYQAKLSDCVASVKYNGTTYTDYVIEWSTNDNLVAYISADGHVNGTGAGKTELIAKLISVGGNNVSDQNIVASTDVFVTAPTIDIGVDQNKFVGESFTIIPEVLIGSTVPTYELSWTSSNDSVATVDQSGNVSVIGPGSAVITAQIDKTNGNPISQYLTITDSITVNAEEIAITSGKLSSDTVTVEVGEDMDAVREALSGITLTLTKNNGQTIGIDNATLFDGVDLSGITTNTAGTHYVNVNYEDPNSDFIFSGVITVQVIDKTLLDKEGVITIDKNVTYVIDTDGIDANEEYVIVIKNSSGKWVALMNPSADSSGGTKGSSQEVTRSSDGQTITISKNADLVEWLFYNKGSSSSNGYSFATFNVSNNLRYIKGGGDSILGGSVKTIHTWKNGDTYFIGMDHSSGKARSLILDGSSFVRSDSMYPDDEDAVYYYLYKRVGTGETYGVGFELTPDSKDIAKGTSFTVPSSGIKVQVGDTYAESYKIEWKSSNEKVATVDSNGKITAVGEGTCTITATLVEANGYKVTNNETNEVGLIEEIAVSVQEDTLDYLIKGSPLTVALGGEPDFSKVSLVIDSSFGDDQEIPSNELVFKYIDAVAGGFDTDIPGKTCNVDVYYNGVKRGVVQLRVANNAYDGLDMATSYPEYPDAGAVRMNKFATGINFNTTGVAKIELNAAGISTRNPVDVVLIVDVSNSMNWSMDWFEGMTDEQVKEANDAAKTDASKDDKLDMAMKAAQEFAAILMENNVSGSGSESNNSMTFVTFGGNDKDRGGTSDVDTVVTAFVGEEVLANVNNSFANTMFTDSQKLAIAGTDGESIVSGSARGNTMYDSAFLEAIDAVNALKIAKAGSVANYDKSGREVHVVFMTDGAPSHYNGLCHTNGNTCDGLYERTDCSDADWLTHIKEPNTQATKLYNMVTDFHIVGYDLAHGGYGTHTWAEADLGRVLGGLVESRALDYTLATDTAKLNNFFNDLGHALAYAGTHALVTDIVSEEFVLQTDDIDLYGDRSEMLAPSIQILERRLVVRTDIGKTLSIDGQNTVIEEKHLGMYVDGGEDILATVTFDTTDPNNKKAFSSALDYGEDIWDDETNIITGKYFTYSFGTKTFEWNIGNITDKEIALTYYGYLTGAKNAENEGGRAEGIYATNEEATLKYINTDNEIVIREYPVPYVAWGKASATVRFFLVNEKGEYTNLAGTPFNNPANRIFLVNSATYQFDLNTNPESMQPGVFTALDAFIQAQVSGQYALYDDVTINITNSTMTNVDGNAYISGGIDKDKTNALVEFIDVYGDGSYIQTTINIPVVTTGRLGTDRPLSGETVVLDYAKPIEVQLFNANELQITNYGYKMELYGFDLYDPAFDTHLYLLPEEYNGKELAEGKGYDTAFGHFEIIDKSIGLIEFTPTTICGGPVQIFAIAKISMTESNPQYNPNNIYYLYNPVSIVPATTVYYETDFANGVFTTKGDWSTANGGAAGNVNQNEDPDVNRVDDDINGKPHVKDNYGFDNSYVDNNLLSGGKSLKAAGAGTANTTVTFSFTGTGFDIISRTGKSQGMIRVKVIDKNGAAVETITITNKGTNELYQIPVVSVHDLEHGTYTVEIGVYAGITYPAGFENLSRGNEFYFDAVRIYDTAKGNKVAETEYKLDGEFAADIFEVRDLLTSRDSFLTNGQAHGVIFMDAFSIGEGNYVSPSAVVDYKNQGANNEVYLGAGQGIAFQVNSTGKAPAKIQIGAKSVDGSTVRLNAAIGDDLNSANIALITKEIATSTDMYYDLSAGLADRFADGKTYVVIWNDSNNVLSITDIKISYTSDPVNAASVEYTQNLGDQASKLLFAVFASQAPEGTLNKGADGNWYYYVGEEVDTSFTGLVEKSGDTWYVQNGQVIFTYNGVAEVDGETYAIKGGKVNAEINGLYKLAGNWVYLVAGKVDAECTGVAEHNGMLVYVESGKVNFGYTGTVSYEGSVYYVRYGLVATTFTGLIKSGDGKWLYIANGVHDTDYTGLAQYGGNWWYVENGTVNLGFTGTVDTENGAWVVNNGLVDIQASSVKN